MGDGGVDLWWSHWCSLLLGSICDGLVWEMVGSICGGHIGVLYEERLVWEFGRIKK